MKNCKSFEKQLITYLHGELNKRDFQTLKTHLESCGSCQAELEAQRATLVLLGASLETAPAPARLVAWRKPVIRRRSIIEKIWFSVQLKAVLGSCAVFSLLFLLSGMLVVFTVVKKEERCFSPPKVVERPKMKLKKPKVKVAKTSKPKPTTRIVTKVNRASMPDIQLPEMSGMGDGLASGIEGFDMMPEFEEVSYFGSGGLMSDTEQSMTDSEGAENDSFASSTVQRPRMPAKKLQIPVRIQKQQRKPKLRQRIVVKPTVNRTMPEIKGIKGGLGTADGAGLGDGIGFSMPEIEAFGVRSNGKKDSPTLGLDYTMPKDDLFGDTGAVTADPVATEPEPLPAKEEPPDNVWDEDRSDSRERKLQPAVFNPYMLAVENAFSTFSIDVDTASYGLARKQLLDGSLPEPEMVRTEEFINSFNYDYRPPTGKQTFAVHVEMAPSPFRTSMDLLKVGIKGRRIGRDDHRGAVLTLVIDTSGSMATPERLGLVKQSLALLIDQLNPTDEVAIIQFGGEARLVREHTPASEKTALLDAINGLQPSGPTQFDKGLELGYQLAKSGFRAGDSNRIMILSDGVANLGELDPEAILEQVAEQRKKGIYLSVLGFGAGTYDDDMLERLANKGDGMYAYIDTLDEARHLLVDQLAATLHVIASDVKIQIEFNPSRVLRYRQIGYENRQLTKEQFRDDTVDAGEVGSGQSVTALYDVELIPDGPEHEPVATVYVRYRRADNGAVEEISRRVMESVRQKSFEDADERFQLAACTAEFAEKLRRSPYAEGIEMKDIAEKLQPVAMELELDEQVKELLRLISIAERLD